MLIVLTSIFHIVFIFNIFTTILRYKGVIERTYKLFNFTGAFKIKSCLMEVSVFIQNIDLRSMSR